MSGRFEEVQRGHLLTEQAHPRSTQLDALTTAELVELFCDEDRRPQEAVAAGAAGGDALVGIAAGGTTPYVHGGLAHAQQLGALAIAMACVPSEQVAMPCDIDIRLITGPELLAGSTRLKAGTATKMALNILSTGVMVRLGKVYGNRMVDVAVTNSKLEDRALRMLEDLGDMDRHQAREWLQRSGGSVKLALLMASAGISASEAQERLSRCDGQLRRALAGLA